MKKGFLLFLAACFSLALSAQKVYFIYLQTEDQSPFYIRMGDKILSSAASGFLILPNLVDTTYYLRVGFAKSNDPESKFSVAMNQADRGFLIKKFDDGLALFDFEELAVVKSNATAKDNTVYETKTDNFSNVLAKAAGDPSIVKVPVVKKEEPKPEKKEVVTTVTEEAKPIAKTDKDTSSKNDVATLPYPKPADTTVAKPNAKSEVATQQQKTVSPSVQQEEPKKQEAAVQEVVYKPSVVTRHSESSTTEGFGVVFFDKRENGTDTIRILIPTGKLKFVSEAEPPASGNVQTKYEKIDSVATAKNQEVDKKTEEKMAPSAVEGSVACKNIATDKDFIKLRKKMAAKNSDDEMIDEAKRDFKAKCYTVEQIRYLSTLFLTPAAKYQFFDSAYSHVSDKNNFALLSTEIKDEYYAKRFKALVGE